MRVPVQRKVEIINSILNEDKRAAVAAIGDQRRKRLFIPG